MWALCRPSQEQLDVVSAFQHRNTLVQAVAGSGKTTTILHAALAYPHRKMLVLTYNARLKEETRQKVQLLRLANLEVHSYHAFAVKYFDFRCFTDAGLGQFLRAPERAPRAPLPAYDACVIDEAQDMTPLYYQVVHRMLRAVACEPQYMVLGDSRQSIFAFNNADARFLEYADRIFASSRGWSSHTLSTSYRCSALICEFVNMCVKSRMLVPAGGGVCGKVVYASINPFSVEATSLILDLLKEYPPDEIFVLAPSVRSLRTPVRINVNTIKMFRPDIQIFVPTHDDEVIDKDVIAGKLVVTTFHQVKGLERNAVVVFNFDSSYFEFYSKGHDPSYCPNEIYVAMTRAKQKLILIQDLNSPPLHFVDMQYVKQNCDFVGNVRMSYSRPAVVKDFEVFVTEITRHLSSQVLLRCLSFIKIKKLRPAGKMINIPTKIKQDNTFEVVSEITGTAINAHVEFIKKGTRTMEMGTPDILPLTIPQMGESENSIYKLLRTATLYCAQLSGYMHKPLQIKRYDWMKEEQLDKCTERIKGLLEEGNTQFEVPCAYSIDQQRISGRIDCTATTDGPSKVTKVYEFKAVKQLKSEHIVQLCFYAFMVMKGLKEEYPHQFLLYNILSDELLEVEASLGELEALVNYVVQVRRGKYRQSDEEFFEMCKNVQINNP